MDRMSPQISHERRPATPQSNFKSLFMAASCASSSGIQITPPSLSHTNLLSVTKPFPDSSSEDYSDLPPSPRMQRASGIPTRYRKDLETSSDDEGPAQTLASSSRSPIPSVLRKSASWSKLFSPSKSSRLSRSRSNPQHSARKGDESESEGADADETTRRAESPSKGLGGPNSLKDRAFDLISNHKRASFSGSSRPSECSEHFN
jgi:hypothetical protein